jgi:hypothetical protein
VNEPPPKLPGQWDKGSFRLIIIFIIACLISIPLIRLINFLYGLSQIH